ncbi:hypothetical protein [Desertivirga arenae]|uniref:hypothetical protein n=1 Tax=Desertivirga arenae TaxID=2810309 RepID=UPI001A968DC3|nr:hypothetical protein [Pedobacter sp. SYSU D00823]
MDQHVFEIGASVQKLSTAALLAASSCMPSNNASNSITTAPPAPRIITYTVPIYDERGRKKTNGANGIGRSSFDNETDINSTLVQSVNKDRYSSNTKNEFNVNVAGVNLPAHYMTNLKTYWDDLDYGLNAYGHRLTVDLELIKEVALYTAGKVALLPAEKSILEFAPDSSIKFTLSFSEGRTLMINKPTELADDFDANEIVFSLFIDDELVSANTNDLDEFIVGFKEYLSA